MSRRNRKMKKYYEEKIKNIELLKEIVVLGYEKKVNEYAVDLINCENDDERTGVVGDLNRLVDLIQDINNEYDLCVKRYNEECEKGNEND